LAHITRPIGLIPIISGQRPMRKAHGTGAYPETGGLPLPPAPI
jgi:hypothetical protein